MKLRERNSVLRKACRCFNQPNMRDKISFPGLVVMGDDSCSKGCGFESGRQILDGMTFFHIDLLQNLYGCLFEKTENKQKKGRGWPI